MVETASVMPVTAVELTCEAEDVGTLFVTFLNEILFPRDQEEMFFCHSKVLEVAVRNGLQTLHAAAWGEPVDFRKHHVRSEVKAATYGGLHYGVHDGVHRLECIVVV